MRRSWAAQFDLAFYFFPCFLVGLCVCVVVFLFFSLHVPLIDLEKKGQLKKTLR